MKKVVEKRKDVVFYLKMFPLTAIHPTAYEQAKAIVCEKSNEKAIKLLEDAYAKKDIPKAVCSTDAIDKNIQLAKKLGISGTPAIIFANGTLKSGAISADELNRLIDKK